MSWGDEKRGVEKVVLMRSEEGIGRIMHLTFGLSYQPPDAYPLTTAFADCDQRIHLVKGDSEWIVDSLMHLGVDERFQEPSREKRILKASSINESIPFICVDASLDNAPIFVLAGS